MSKSYSGKKGGCLYPSRLKYTDSVDLSNGRDHYLFKEDLSKNIQISNSKLTIFKLVKGYRRGYVAIGLILITISFVFVFSYVGFIVNKEYANVTGNLINVTRLDPQDPINLLIFGILVCIGTSLLVKGLL